MRTWLNPWLLALLTVAVGSPVSADLVFEDYFVGYPSGNGNPGTPPVGDPWTVEDEQYAENIRIGDVGADQSLIVQRHSGQSTAPKAVANISSADSVAMTDQLATIDVETLLTDGGHMVYTGGARRSNGDVQAVPELLRRGGHQLLRWSQR